jgi:polysaccharide pyruvyl transferase WcaK-like protein
MAVVKRVPISSRSEFSFVVAPNGGGNIGDQALMEAYIRNTPGKIVVLASAPNSFIFDEMDQRRIRTVNVPMFIYGPPFLRLPAAFRVARLIQHATTVSVIGADLMDGLYNPGASLARISVLRIAGSLGVIGVLMGCSWAANAEKTAVLAMKRAAEAGATLNFRDSLSLERAKNQGIRGRLTSDIVFATGDCIPHESTADFVKYSRAKGHRLALVNSSGLIAKRFEQTPDYSTIVDALLARNYCVVLVPHVFRAGGDDLHEAQKIYAANQHDSVHLVEEMLRPDQVRWICSEAELVITGRMHLAVMAMSQATKAITLGTHGKVEGLYRHFGDLDYCVQPAVGFSRQVIDLIDMDPAEDRDWERFIPDVQALALENFRQITARP